MIANSGSWRDSSPCDAKEMNEGERMGYLDGIVVFKQSVTGQHRVLQAEHPLVSERAS